MNFNIWDEESVRKYIINSTKDESLLLFQKKYEYLSSSNKVKLLEKMIEYSNYEITKKIMEDPRIYENISEFDSWILNTANAKEFYELFLNNDKFDSFNVLRYIYYNGLTHDNIEVVKLFLNDKRWNFPSNMLVNIFNSQLIKNNIHIIELLVNDSRIQQIYQEILNICCHNIFNTANSKIFSLVYNHPCSTKYIENFDHFIYSIRHDINILCLPFQILEQYDLFEIRDLVDYCYNADYEKIEKFDYESMYKKKNCFNKSFFKKIVMMIFENNFDKNQINACMMLLRKISKFTSPNVKKHSINLFLNYFIVVNFTYSSSFCLIDFILEEDIAINYEFFIKFHRMDIIKKFINNKNFIPENCDLSTSDIIFLHDNGINIDRFPAENFICDLFNRDFRIFKKVVKNNLFLLKKKFYKIICGYISDYLIKYYLPTDRDKNTNDMDDKLIYLLKFTDCYSFFGLFKNIYEYVDSWDDKIHKIYSKYTDIICSVNNLFPSDKNNDTIFFFIDLGYENCAIKIAMMKNFNPNIKYRKMLKEAGNKGWMKFIILLNKLKYCA